jgi:hypothetical protein
MLVSWHNPAQAAAEHVVCEQLSHFDQRRETTFAELKAEKRAGRP